MSKIDQRTKDVLKKHNADPDKVLWNCHGKLVAYHAALEDIARNAKITFDPPQIIEANGADKIAAICVVGHMEGHTEWSIGEAAPANNKNAYPWAMAEKRAKDRVILKLIGLHGDVYSEEEADDFKPAPQAVKQAANQTPKRTITGKTADEWVSNAISAIESAAELGDLAEIETANKEAFDRLGVRSPEKMDTITKAIGNARSRLFQSPQAAE